MAVSVEQTRTTVAADVMERSNKTVAITDNDHTVDAEIDRQVIAGRRYGIDVAGNLPTGPKDALSL
jgi:hypothetical protein